MAIERFSSADILTQTTQADEILSRPSTVKIEELLSGGASSSAAAAASDSPTLVSSTIKSVKTTARTQMRGKKGLAQPVGIRPDITTEIKYNLDWNVYFVDELKAQLKLRTPAERDTGDIDKLKVTELKKILFKLDKEA